MTCTEMKKTGELLKFLEPFVPDERTGELLILVNDVANEWNNYGYLAGQRAIMEQAGTYDDEAENDYNQEHRS